MPALERRAFPAGTHVGGEGGPLTTGEPPVESARERELRFGARQRAPGGSGLHGAGTRMPSPCLVVPSGE